MVSEGKSTDYLNDDVSRERVVLSATVIASLQSRMKDEQNHIGDLSREVEKLQKEIEKRKGVVAKIKDLLSPIRQIPQEMLVEIFSHYIQLQNAEVKGPDFGVLGRKCVYRRLLPVVLLSLICSQWKQIVDTTPRLWTQLRIFVYNWFYPVTPPPQTVVVKWIQRSGSLPLDFTIDTPSGRGLGNSDPYTSYLEVLIPVAGRLRSLTVYMGIRALYHLSEKSDLSFPILEEFTFEPTREYWFGQESFMLGNVFKLPRLSSLKFLLNSCFHFESFDSFPFPLSNLKHLHLYACHRDAMDLRELLRACPLLETCNLIAVPNFKVAGIENDLPTDEFPHLRHLTLKFGGIIGSPGFLNGVRLPALEKLDLHLPKYFAPEPDEDDNHPHILPYLTSLHDRAPFPLRELTLAYCVHDKAADIVTFLKRFNSTLQTLNLDDCKLDVPVFCGALRATTECKVPLPNLTKISITQTQEEEYYDLDDPEEAGFDHPRETDIIIADMVLSRWRPYADDEDVVDKDTEIGKEVASRSKKGGKKKVGRGKGKGKVKGTTETSIPTTKWPVAKLTRGFTFLTYHRDLEEEAMAKLNECKEEGMPLEVDWGKIPDYDSGH